MAEKIILEVDVQGLANDIQNARVALDSYRIAMERSVEENGKFSKEATISKAQFDAQNKAVKQLEGQLLRVTQAQQANNAILKDLIKQGYDPATKSVDQNRKVLNALTAEYNRASKEGRDKLAPTIKQISDELKKQEGAIGDTRRNVGNYREAIAGALGDLKGFGGQVVAVGQNIGGAVNAFKAAEGGVKGFSAALATTGLPLIVMGINALTEALSTFKPIADAVENTVNALSAGFRALITGGNLGEAVKSSRELLEVMRDLEDTQDAYNITLEKSRNEIAALIIQSKDRTKTEKERTELLEKAEKLEKENYDKAVKRNSDLLQKQQAVLKQKLGIGDAELKLLAETDDANNVSYSKLRKRLEDTKGLTDEELKKYQDTLLEKAKLDGEYNVFLEKIVNSRNKLVEKQEAEAEKRAENEAKRKEKELQDAIALKAKLEALSNKAINDEKTLREFRLNQEEDSLNKRLMLFDLNSEAYEQALRDAGATEIEIANWRNREIKNITDKFNKEQLDATKQTEKGKQDAQQETVDKTKQNTELLTKDTQNLLSNISAIATGVMNLIGAIGDNIAQQSEQNIANLEAQKEAGIITEDEFNRRAKEQKIKAFNEAKALNIVMAVMNTANAVMAQLSNPTPYVGIALAALAAATGAVQIATIAKQQPPKFAEGGSVFDVGGKSHAQGGTLYTGADGNRFEVEKGEKIFVMKRTASRHIDALGGLNMAFGGRSWSDSPIRYAADGGQIQDGGFAIRATSEQANTTVMLKQFAKSIVSEMPTPVVSVVEFEKVQTGRKQSIAVSKL